MIDLTSLAAIQVPSVMVLAALALLWCASLVALQTVQRKDVATRSRRLGSFVVGSTAVGVGWWATLICAYASVAGDATIAMPALRATALLALTTVIAALSLFAGCSAARWQVVLGVLAGAGGWLGMQVGWANALELPIPPSIIVSLALAGLISQGALVLQLARVHRSPNHVALPRLARLAVLPVATTALPVLVLPLTLAPPIAASIMPGPELLYALLAAIIMLLELRTQRLERLLENRYLQLNDQLRKTKAKLERKPSVDQLTGLSNRFGVELTLVSAAAIAEKNGGRVALLYIGFDGFKHVNDSYGHSLGDSVLTTLAALLVEHTRKLIKAPQIVAHSVGRVGGAEFAVLLTGQLDRSSVVYAANQLQQVLEVPLVCNQHEVALSASIGVACFPEGGAAKMLLSHADSAMQASRRAGGANFAFFEPHMMDDARAQQELLRDLRCAIDEKKLELFYQPKIDARSGQVTAAEALLRWNHPTRGMISPTVVVPLAERYGLIGALGNWVIEDACRQARVWREHGLKMRVAINLSVYQMRQDDLADRIKDALKRYGINPSRLTCEITESVAMEDTQATHRTFEQLGAAGVHLSIDDFGTGYSSLSYLRKLPAAELKIDRSFVMDLETSSDARAVVEAVLKLAHTIGLKVVAEGVENEKQREILLQLGCDEFQGYLFAKPMSARALLIWAMDDMPAKNEFRASLFSETTTPTEIMPELKPPASGPAPTIDKIKLD
ncbi:MAG: bifunctional diguanylate cyclase/phosphodiesterase [Burkholderiaceae bacterium]|nr:bifunctional diguanylate cyclase/phosphodiesterase [Burkholderiaceae bacterium]